MKPILVLISHMDAVEEIQLFLDRRVESWNRGDLEAFLAGYSDDARIMSTNGIINGTDIPVVYRKRYPSASEMGELLLQVEKINPISHMSQHLVAWVWIKWTLGDESGRSLLVLRRLPSWEIVAEATV